jgi:O-methyltransferase involved in polyketide biosynthesis
LDKNGESISREGDFEEMNRDKHRRHIVWTNEEDSVVIREFLNQGRRWTKTAKLVEGRGAIHVKSHWHCLLRQRLTRKKAAGIDVWVQMEAEFEKDER